MSHKKQERLKCRQPVKQHLTPMTINSRLTQIMQFISSQSMVDSNRKRESRLFSSIRQRYIRYIISILVPQQVRHTLITTHLEPRGLSSLSLTHTQPLSETEQASRARKLSVQRSPTRRWWKVELHSRSQQPPLLAITLELFG